MVFSQEKYVHMNKMMESECCPLNNVAVKAGKEQGLKSQTQRKGEGVERLEHQQKEAIHTEGGMALLLPIEENPPSSPYPNQMLPLLIPGKGTREIAQLGKNATRA